MNLMTRQETAEMIGISVQTLDRRVVECLVDSGHMSINRDAMYHDGGEQ